MKKSLVVLLIVVLAVGSAFAAISGKFTGKYAIDFDKKEAGYTKGNPDFDFTLYADTKETANEGNVYAKLAVSAKFGAYTSDPVYSSGIGYNWTITKKNDTTKEVADIESQWSLSVTEASINGADWKLDLVSTMNTANYAADGIDTLTSGDYSAAYGYSLKLADKTSTIPGTTLTYKGYKLGTGFNGPLADATSAIVSVETADLAFNDFTAKAFAGYSKQVNDIRVAGSVKAAYSDVATVAADFGYTKEKFDADVALNVKYAPVTVDAYFATAASATVKDDKDNKVAENTIANLLSAKIAADLATYEVPVKLTVTGKNLLNDARNFDVVAETTYVADTTLTGYFKNILSSKKVGAKAEYTGIEATTLTGEVSYTIGTKTLAVSADAEYEADLYTATFGAGLTYVDAAELTLSAGISSEKLVSGATLSLDYASGDNILAAGNIGAVTASCEIAF